jgi:hypothetical protein
MTPDACVEIALQRIGIREKKQDNAIAIATGTPSLHQESRDQGKKGHCKNATLVFVFPFIISLNIITTLI